jgi:Ca2+/Na+ antiporter
MEFMDKNKITTIPSSTELRPGTQIATPEETDKWNNIALKNSIFWFIVVIISFTTIVILFLPFIKLFSPSFEIDEWVLRLLIVGMLAQPYLLLKIVTKYLFSK